ncbi:sirohydrochlorin ferrochelatase [Paenibacillus sp. RC254]|uniref:sirohydrochlorin chelatase n=1 Tax=unclassified Paenibacillus TaxID=185978 RepID=UPI0024B933C9|nr:MULTISPECIES: CbiX/SirB N-terminal domain-containing protein [unclassified Paenibacillus]
MRSPGVLVISHGSRESYWVEQVDQAAAKLHLPKDMPLEVSFLETVKGRLIQNGIDRLESLGVTDLLVVPLFMSSGSTHVDEISYALGVKDTPDKETDLKPFRIKACVHFGSPVDDGEDVAHMVWDKVSPLSVNPARETILLVGHGSVHDGFFQRWERGISSLARTVQRVSSIATDYALLNPESVYDKVAYWKQERGHDVIVAPLFLSSGYFTSHIIPGRLQGLEYRYSGDPLLPHPLLTSWMNGQICELLQRMQKQD